MAKREQFKPGTAVRLKHPSHIYAEVIGPCDAGLPAGQVSYKIRILPLARYAAPEDLELAEAPQDAGSQLEYMSSEWVKELGHLNDLAARWLAHRRDGDISTQFADSLMKLGLLVQGG